MFAQYPNVPTILTKPDPIVSCHMLTPIIILSTSIIFFSCIIFKDSLLYYSMFFAMTPLNLAIMIGMIQNILSESSECALFDPTKEMSYIPLNKTLKTKGKAAIDVAGGKIGKALGSIMQQVLLIGLAVEVINTQGAIAPYLFFFVLAVCMMWVHVVIKLNKQFIQYS